MNLTRNMLSRGLIALLLAVTLTLSVTTAANEPDAAAILQDRLDWMIAHGAPASYEVQPQTITWPGGSATHDYVVFQDHGQFAEVMTYYITVSAGGPMVATMDVCHKLKLPFRYEMYYSPEWKNLTPRPCPIGEPDPQRPGYFFSAKGDTYKIGEEYTGDTGHYLKTAVPIFGWFVSLDRWHRLE